MSIKFRALRHFTGFESHHGQPVCITLSTPVGFLPTLRAHNNPPAAYSRQRRHANRARRRHGSAPPGRRPTARPSDHDQLSESPSQYMQLLCCCTVPPAASSGESSRPPPPAPLLHRFTRFGHSLLYYRIPYTSRLECLPRANSPWGPGARCASYLALRRGQLTRLDPGAPPSLLPYPDLNSRGTTSCPRHRVHVVVLSLPSSCRASHQAALPCH
jgi:hypothetical protein